jgi:hypothetical protein
MGFQYRRLAVLGIGYASSTGRTFCIRAISSSVKPDHPSSSLCHKRSSSAGTIGPMLRLDQFIQIIRLAFDPR